MQSLPPEYDAAMARRRREASQRLPPLDGDVHDPFDRLAGIPFIPVQWPIYDVIDLGLVGCDHGANCPARSRKVA